MVSRFLPLMFLMSLFTCQPRMQVVDYFNQQPPTTEPAIFAPGVISQLGRLEHGISFASDGRELAFGILDKENYSGSIYHAEKTGRKWDEPRPFEKLGEASIYLPYFSPNGSALLYTQSKDDSDSYVTDIWMMRKKEGAWSTPEVLGMPISSMAREATACITLDNTVYFSSNREGNGLADLYSYALDGSDYETANPIKAINTERDEESVFVAPDGSYIIFSRYSTNDSGPDLFISYQDANSEWTDPVALNYKINSNQWERRPFVSFDDKYLFYTKMEISNNVIVESDIYWVSTEKVFSPFVYRKLEHKRIQVNKETRISVPLDYFSDVDGRKLQLDVVDAPRWVNYDDASHTLSLKPQGPGEYDIVFTATDEFANVTMDVVKIIVE